MYEGYEILKKYVDLIAKTTTEEEALDAVAKIALDAAYDSKLVDAAMKYVNECLEQATIDNGTYYC